MNDNKRNPEPPATRARERGQERATEEQRLDDSIDDSFPASDPSSITRAPRDRRYAVEPPAAGADRKTPANPGPEA